MNQNTYNLLAKHGILNIINHVHPNFLFGYFCSFSAFTHYVHNLQGNRRTDDLMIVLLMSLWIRTDAVFARFHFEAKEAH